MNRGQGCSYGQQETLNGKETDECIDVIRIDKLF